ncbi:hypothetical protein E4T39_06621 [Aureobasidium subglaciale]|nr:hypothetical protein E4T39_06621 [Aureobasidium subglaciale]
MTPVDSDSTTLTINTPTAITIPSSVLTNNQPISINNHHELEKRHEYDCLASWRDLKCKASALWENRGGPIEGRLADYRMCINACRREHGLARKIDRDDYDFGGLKDDNDWPWSKHDTLAGRAEIAALEDDAMTDSGDDDLTDDEMFAIQDLWRTSASNAPATYSVGPVNVVITSLALGMANEDITTTAAPTATTLMTKTATPTTKAAISNTTEGAVDLTKRDRPGAYHYCKKWTVREKCRIKAYFGWHTTFSHRFNKCIHKCVVKHNGDGYGQPE